MLSLLGKARLCGTFGVLSWSQAALPLGASKEGHWKEAMQRLLLPCAVEAWAVQSISAGLVQKHGRLQKGSAGLALEGEECPGGRVQVAAKAGLSPAEP